MDVGMMQKGLSPGVKHAEEPDLGAQVLRIGGDLDQGLGAGAEQQSIKDALVVPHQLGKVVGQCEDDVYVGDRQ